MLRNFSQDNPGQCSDNLNPCDLDQQGDTTTLNKWNFKQILQTHFSHSSLFQWNNSDFILKNNNKEFRLRTLAPAEMDESEANLP